MLPHATAVGGHLLEPVSAMSIVEKRRIFRNYFSGLKCSPAGRPFLHTSRAKHLPVTERCDTVQEEGAGQGQLVEEEACTRLIRRSVS